MPGIFRMVATAGPQGSAGLVIDVFVADHIYAPVLVVRGTIERIRDDSGDVAQVDGGVPACHARGSTSGFNGFSPRAGLEDPARAGRAGWRSSPWPNLTQVGGERLVPCCLGCQLDWQTAVRTQSASHESGNCCPVGVWMRGASDST